MGFFDDIGKIGSDIVNTIGGVAESAGKDVAAAAETAWNQESDAIETFGKDFVTGAGGIFSDLEEAGQKFGEGFGELAKGNVGDAFKDWGSGLLKGFIQTPADAALVSTAGAVSSIGTSVGIEPTGRKLTDAEITELKKVYGDSLDYSEITVKEGDEVMTAGAEGRTVGNTIYIKDGFTMDQLIHEAGHAWQYEHGGDDYTSDALWGQAFGEGYDYEKAIREGKSWSELNPEQQSDLIEYAYVNGYFDTGVWNGRPDLTDYMNQVLPQLRSGNGAA